MIKNSITKRKVLSLILAFALFVSFLPINLLKAADEMNYAKDEAKIEDYSDSERYRQTDLQPGDTNQEFYKTDEKQEKDGFKFVLKNPSSESPSKTEWGYQITINKEKGQRTYTSLTVTDSGRVPAQAGEKPMMDVGDKLISESTEFPKVNFKPTDSGKMTASKTQRNYNYLASEETLKHINSKDNPSTSFGMKDNYTQDNPETKFFGVNFFLGYKVNPWPNENDKLELMKLNGDYKEKVFVQGQEIDTGIKVDNIDENAKERIVGQVYHPISGDVVPGAKAFIKNGTIHIQMPEGALKKDENNKTVINEDSIFNTKEYKGLQQLDVKFFARPRTADEFTKIAETPDEFGYAGTYVETGAGSRDINHEGNTVKVDNQGIDRYDHYNLIGAFKLNLDDTRYYDQSFKDPKGEDTSDRTYLNVKPGVPFKVEMYEPANPSDTDKSPEEMNGADARAEASGKIIMDFINKENKGKAEKDQWKLDVDPNDISKFTITPPASAKAGDFIALPIEYTYTNGSKDLHYFHFVVQEASNNKPEYLVQVEFPSMEQKSTPIVPEDEKKLSPVSYSIPEGTEFKDDHGNEWTVSIDETTGEVTAKPINPSDFTGGEKLQVPVVAHYKDPDEPEKEITENATAEFVIKERFNMTARYNAKAGKAGDQLTSNVILNESDQYNRRPGKYTLPSDTFVDDKGNTWNVTIDENTGQITATVPNAEDGKSIDGALLNVPVTAHYYEADGEEVGTRVVEAQFVASGTEGKHELVVEIPFETKVEKNPNLKKGEIVTVTEGKLGKKKISFTIKDSKVVEGSIKEETIEEKQDALIQVGEGVLDGTHEIKETAEVPFETEIQFDDKLKPGEIEEIQKGVPGEKTRTTTLTIEDGKVTKTEEGEYTETKAPKKRIIKVGRNTEGKIEHKEDLPFGYKVVEVETLKKGEYKIVKPGKVGTKTTTWTIKNSQIEGEPTVTTDPAEDAIIQVGKGTNDGTHKIVEKKEIPFETRYEYDDSIEPGKEEVVTPGAPGLQERTNTLVIKDGKVVETQEGEFKTTKNPQERLIKIGRKSTEGEVTKTIEREIPYETKVIYDDNLEAGTQQIESEGKAGKEEVTITQKIKDSKPVGEATETTKTIIEKEDRVVRVGVKPVVKEIELGNDTEYIHNPELKAGEEKIVEKGSKGSVKYTTTFNKKTGKLEVTEEKVEPKNKIVEYGTKTEGQFKYESEQAYDVIIRENPNLEAGKHNIVQKGIVGKTETTVKIENSKEVSRDIDIIAEKQDMIIEIGTKNVCDIPPLPEEPEKPGTENPDNPGTENPEKPGTENPEKPGTENPEKPGTKNPEKPGTENPEKPGTKNPEKPGTKDPDNNKGKNPTASSKDNTSKANDAKQNNISKTGVVVSAYPVIGLVFVAGAAWLIRKRKED